MMPTGLGHACPIDSMPSKSYDLEDVDKLQFSSNRLLVVRLRVI